MQKKVSFVSRKRGCAQGLSKSFSKYHAMSSGIKPSLNQIFTLIEQFKELAVRNSFHWENYNYYSIVHHSTSIEGASLTEKETQLLLDKNLTAKRKPVVHHNMQTDLYRALLWVVEKASQRSVITPSLLREIAGKAMEHTGGIHNTILGSFDSSMGDFRLHNVHAGETRFVDYTKVPGLVEKYCDDVNAKLKSCSDPAKALLISFDAHFHLVTIHPFGDGNGRVSRLVMNYVQQFCNLPLANVFKEDKADYYKALVDTRKNKDVSIFREYMLSQYSKMLEMGISRALNSGKRM
ncbi:MAG: Fic family protein [bacterium]